MNEREAQEQREAAARQQSEGWVPVLVQWIPCMLVVLVPIVAMFFGMYYIEHGTLDITQPIINEFIVE